MFANIPETQWAIYSPTRSVGASGGKVITYNTLVGTFDVAEQLERTEFVDDNQQEGNEVTWIGYMRQDAGYTPNLLDRVTLSNGAYARVIEFDAVPAVGNIDAFYMIRVRQFRETS